MVLRVAQFERTARPSPVEYLHVVTEPAADGSDSALGAIAEAVDRAWQRGEGVWIASRDLEWMHHRLGLKDRLADGTPLVWFGPGRRSLAQRLFARAMDLGLSAGVLVAGAPAWTIVAALVFLSDRGPVFFAHERAGEGGRSFRFLKFRTMRPCQSPGDHDRHRSHRERRRAAIAECARDEKTTEAGRVTKVGRLLRHTGLDEVPQFLHVLAGRMSVVGPRPYVLWEVDSFQPWHRHRTKVRPGITGLWQVRGYHEVSFDRSVMLDLFYVANASWRMDLKIILRTPLRMLRGLEERW